MTSPARIDFDNPADLQALRELAESAARAGGQVARDYFRRQFTVRRKPDGSDVTDADESAQAAVLDVLRRQRPDDAVIAEEDLPADAPAPANDTLCWIIDPLDGTRNFVCGVPIYACAIAAMIGGVPVVGAVYDPEHDEMCSTARGAGLFVDGQPFTRTPTPSSGGATRRPLVGIPSSLSGPAATLVRSWASTVVVRNLGATALHLAMVATGRLQAALVSDSKLWDIAGGWLMVMNAGGVMTTVEDRDVFPRDIADYRGESIPALAAADQATHARLLSRRGRMR
ncbi:MAG: inositol monophosphatase family protein [Phycisphaerae bacterium]|jgi:myo-inositol-1(or 4)-monophosphatase